MSRKENNNFKRNFIIIVMAVIVVTALVISFANSGNTPSWQEIVGSKSGEEHDDYIKFLDVGQGDSILIGSNGQSMLIDTGSESFGDAVAQKIFSYGFKKLDMMMLSHNHEDHVGGAEIISKKMNIDNLLLPNIKNTKEKTRIIESAKSEVLANEGECYTAKKGTHTKIGDIAVSVLACYYEDNDENDRSIIAMAELNGFKVLLTGDAGTQSENKMLKEGINVDCDVLKVGHHGSSSSSGKKFLKAATPEYAIISCGVDNQYSHPHEETLYRLEQVNAKVFRTDISGEITLYFDNGEITVKTEK